MVFIKKELTEKEYDRLVKLGAQAILDYGFDYLRENGYIETDKNYRGSYLHKEKEKNVYELVCKIGNGH